MVRELCGLRDVRGLEHRNTRGQHRDVSRKSALRVGVVVARGSARLIATLLTSPYLRGRMPVRFLRREPTSDLPSLPRTPRIAKFRPLFAGRTPEGMAPLARLKPGRGQKSRDHRDTIDW